MSFRKFALILFTALIAASAAAQTASFTGTVRNSSGVPLGDMTVQAYNPAGFPVTTTTDSQGRYLLVVPPGTYRLVAYDNSGTYAVEFYGGVNAFEKSQAINVTEGQVVRDINFVLPPGLKISGIVVNASMGGGLHGAVVAAYNLDGSRRTYVTTNQDGSYTLTVPPGSYKVVAYHEVTPFIPVFFQNKRLFTEADIVTPPAAQVSFGLVLGVKISGSVKDKTSGAPLGGLAVVAYDLQGNVQYRTETNPAGNFAFVLPNDMVFKFAVEDASGNYQTKFYRDATSFASAAAIPANSSAPLLVFSVGRGSTDESLTTVYIPGIIHAENPGLSTFFKTDVWIQNPGDQAITVTATFLRGGQDNTNTTGLPVTVPARGQVFLQDIVSSLFGTSGAGALRLDASAPFRATSRTYNVPPNAAQMGTFGLSIPGQTIGASLGRATLAGLSQNTSSRSNIGLFNPQPHPINLRIEIFSATGSLLGSGAAMLRPGEWAQPSVRTWVPTDFDQAYAVISSEDGSFFSYAAVVDAKSQDGTIILPSGD